MICPEKPFKECQAFNLFTVRKFMAAQFSSNENKALLWNMLSTHGAFNGLPASSGDIIKDQFERTVKNISESKSPLSSSLVDLNKMTLSAMMRDLESFRQGPPKPTPPQRELSLVSAAAIQEQKQAVFQQGLTNKQTEFNTFMVNPIPPKIDFTDKNSEIDKPLGSEMDRLLAEAMAKREMDLNVNLPPAAAPSTTMPPSILKIGPELKSALSIQPLSPSTTSSSTSTTQVAPKKMVNFLDDLTNATKPVNALALSPNISEEMLATQKEILQVLRELVNVLKLKE